MPKRSPPARECPRRVMAMKNATTLRASTVAGVPTTACRLRSIRAACGLRCCGTAARPVHATQHARPRGSPIRSRRRTRYIRGRPDAARPASGTNCSASATSSPSWSPQQAEQNRNGAYGKVNGSTDPRCRTGAASQCAHRGSGRSIPPPRSSRTAGTARCSSVTSRLSSLSTGTRRAGSIWATAAQTLPRRLRPPSPG